MIDELLYLDRDYISSKYEEVTGKSPSVKITKTEGLSAGVKIPLFSAGASALESKSYKLSTNSMLAKILDTLREFPDFDASKHNVGKTSCYCWVTGEMSVSKVTLKRNKYTLTIIGKPKESDKPTEEILSEEMYFAIKDSKGNKFALLATGDYFSSGIESVVNLSSTITNEVLFPVRALLRVLPAKSNFNEWASIPIVINENGG